MAPPWHSQPEAASGYLLTDAWLLVVLMLQTEPVGCTLEALLKTLLRRDVQHHSAFSWHQQGSVRRCRPVLLE